MNEHTKEIHKQEMDALSKTFMGFLFAIVSILSMWFMSGLLYVILK